MPRHDLPLPTKKKQPVTLPKISFIDEDGDLTVPVPKKRAKKPQEPARPVGRPRKDYRPPSKPKGRPTVRQSLEANGFIKAIGAKKGAAALPDGNVCGRTLQRIYYAIAAARLLRLDTNFFNKKDAVYKNYRWLRGRHLALVEVGRLAQRYGAFAGIAAAWAICTFVKRGEVGTTKSAAKAIRTFWDREGEFHTRGIIQFTLDAGKISQAEADAAIADLEKGLDKQYKHHLDDIDVIERKKPKC